MSVTGGIGRTLVQSDLITTGGSVMQTMGPLGYFLDAPSSRILISPV